MVLSTQNITHRSDAIVKGIPPVFSADQTSENYIKLRVPYSIKNQLLHMITGTLKVVDKVIYFSVAHLQF